MRLCGPGKIVHRAACADLYLIICFSDGYNKWRDAKRPTTILAELCRSNGIDPPEYRTAEVKVLNKIFKTPPDAVPEGEGQLLLPFLFKVDTV